MGNSQIKPSLKDGGVFKNNWSPIVVFLYTLKPQVLLHDKGYRVILKMTTKME